MSDSRYALVGGLVLDSDCDSFRAATVHVYGDLVVAVDALPAQSDETTIDVHGQFLLPGLIDSHYHLVSRSSEQVTDRDLTESMLEGVRNAEDTLSSGVTTVRDCGCRTVAIYSLQGGIAEGSVCGPDSVAAGQNPTGAAAPRHWRNVFADGPGAMREAVRSQVEAGAQWVKLILAHAESPLDWADVTVFMSDAEIAAAIEEAHALGVRIGAHCEGREVAERGVELGLDSLDHAPLLSEKAVAGMAARGMTYTPTVWAFSDDSGIDLDALSEADRDAVLHWREEHRASVRRAAAAGVPIAAGSDSASAVTGAGVLAHELEALVACGLSTAQVLAAATQVGAALVGRSGEIGRIAPGLRADLVGLAADPLADIAAVRNPLWVRRAGALRFEQGRGLVPVRRRASLAEETVARW